jgi:hypothetical protein
MAENSGSAAPGGGPSVPVWETWLRWHAAQETAHAYVVPRDLLAALAEIDRLRAALAEEREARAAACASLAEVERLRQAAAADRWRDGVRQAVVDRIAALDKRLTRLEYGPRYWAPDAGGGALATWGVVGGLPETGAAGGGGACPPCGGESSKT